MNDKAKELLNCLVQNDMESAKVAFATAIQDKLNNALEIRKVGLTSKIFNTSSNED